MGGALESECAIVSLTGRQATQCLYRQNFQQKGSRKRQFRKPTLTLSTSGRSSTTAQEKDMSIRCYLWPAPWEGRGARSLERGVEGYWDWRDARRSS